MMLGSPSSSDSPEQRLLVGFKLKLDQTLIDMESVLGHLPGGLSERPAPSIAAAVVPDLASMLLEAHDDFSNINDLNLQSERVSTFKRKDNAACSVIVGEVDTIDERHKDAALASLELSCSYVDDFLLQKIDMYGDITDALISRLQTDMLQERAQMSAAERSCSLIEASIQAKYNRMRDGYLALTKQLHKESREQFAAAMTVPRRHMQWHLERLSATFESYRLNEELQQKRHVLNDSIDQSFTRLCEQGFHRLAASTAYEETELYLSLFGAARQEVLTWKSDLVTACEERLNHAEIGLDSLYMSSLEEIDHQLYVLQDSLHKLEVHEKKLDNLLLLGQSRLSCHAENDARIAELTGDWDGRVKASASDTSPALIGTGLSVPRTCIAVISQVDVSLCLLYQVPGCAASLPLATSRWSAPTRCCNLFWRIEAVAMMSYSDCALEISLITYHQYIWRLSPGIDDDDDDVLNNYCTMMMMTNNVTHSYTQYCTYFDT